MRDTTLYSYPMAYYWGLKNKLYRLDYAIENEGKTELIPEYNEIVKEINSHIDFYRAWEKIATK